MTGPEGEAAYGGVEGTHCATNSYNEVDIWIEALVRIAKRYRLPVSPQSARLTASWSEARTMEERIAELALGLGLRVQFNSPDSVKLSSWHLPVILQLQGGEVAILTALSPAGEAEVLLNGGMALPAPFNLRELLRDVERIVTARPARSTPDVRVDTYIQPVEEHWLRRIVLSDLRPYGHVMLASLVANSLGLAGILFSMQVYDRVIPAESYPTLYVLFSGVVLALLFDFIMRRTRMSVVDLLGKRADLRISDRVMGRALRVRNRARPKASGTFIAQLRDLEQVRDVLTSTTVVALADLPFFFLFLFVFWHIAGGLVFIPSGALLLMIIPGLLAQRKLRMHAQEAMREASLRNAMLVEAIQGIEDIKTLQAEERFQQQWNHFNAVTANAQIRLRALTNGLNVWTHSIQTGIFATVVVMGAPLVMAGEMTTGALVAASILGSRMMAPMGQITQVMSRLQQAKVAARGLDQIMQLPVDYPDGEDRIHRPHLKGQYEFRSAVFRYGDDASPAALSIRELQIEPGEKIAVLGKIGAGKSTLLQALGGLLEPSTGQVLLDNLILQHIDPADVRRDVGLLMQNARLFHGTLRDNITMGAPFATDAEVLNALSMVGADGFLQNIPNGLDHLVLEGGRGLSGGQTQAILLARTLIRRPRIVLLDEPTASLDEAAERVFINKFRTWTAGKTLVLATHRTRVLELVDRIIVIENGKIALDNSKEVALEALRGPGTAASRRTKSANKHSLPSQAK